MVSDGQAVLDAIQTAHTQGDRPYDVILLDITMPILDGLETSRRIRALGPRIWQPRLIAMTGHVGRGDRERCLAAGMDDYLSKPIQLEALAQILTTDPSAPNLGSSASPASSENQPDLINQERLTASLWAMGDDIQESLDLLRTTYLEEAPLLLSNLQNAWGQRNLEAVRFAAHTLKSSSMAMGAERIAQICQRVEQQIIQARSSQIPSLIAQAERIYQETTIALTAMTL
jgi:CheY-like chemotaxis protein